MKALITGAAGFIGSTLVERLTDDGMHVIGIDSIADYYDPRLKLQNLAGIDHPRFTFVRDDLNVAPLDDILNQVDVVFHLAGQPGVRKSWGAHFGEYVSSNIEATQRLLEASLRSERPPRIVYASSSSVYGDAEVYPTNEDLAPRPRSPYGVTKLAAEHLCRLYSSNYGLSTVSLRFFTVYGPKQRPDMAFTRFLRAAVADETIHVYGTGEQVRDFTFVSDIVGALVAAGSADVAAGSVYNVSGGGSHSVNEVLDVIAELVDHPLTVERGEVALGDVSRTSADISRITAELGWQPEVALREGLAAQLEWVRSPL